MMRYTTSLAALAVLTALILLGAPVTAGAQQTEWLQWGGPQGDFMTDVTGLAESWPEGGPPEIWSRPPGAGHSAILVADGRLFTMYRVSHGEGGGRPWSPSETVIAMSADTGETLWEYTYASMNQDFGQGAGPHSTPLIVGDRLFTMGTNKELHVFDPATGKLLWSKNLVTDFGAPPLLIRSMVKPRYGVNPIGYKDTIIMQVGGPGQSVMALRQRDGEVVWKSGSFLVSHAPSGLISVDGRQHLVVFGGQAVFGMDPDTGQVLWAHAHDAGNDFNFQVPLYSDEDKILFFSSGYIGGSRAIRLVPDGDIVHTEELWYDPRLRFTFLNAADRRLHLRDERPERHGDPDRDARGVRRDRLAGARVQSRQHALRGWEGDSDGGRRRPVACPADPGRARDAGHHAVVQHQGLDRADARRHDPLRPRPGADRQAGRRATIVPPDDPGIAPTSVAEPCPGGSTLRARLVTMRRAYRRWS